VGSDGSKESCLTWDPDPRGKGQFWGKGSPIVKYRDFLPCAVRCANRLNQDRRGWTGMPGHVGHNDTDFILLQEELNAPIANH